MKYLLLKLFLISLYSIFVNMDCEYDSFFKEVSPILLNITNKKNITILPTSVKFMIKPNDKIFAVCPGGMDFLMADNIPSRYSAENPNQQSAAPSFVVNLTFYCVNGVINGDALDLETLTTKKFNNIYGLNCKPMNRFDVFMKVGYGSCSHNYYAIGIQVFDKIYEFLQICFDLRGMKTVFVRFIARPMQQLLNEYITLVALDNKQSFMETDIRYKTPVERKKIKKVQEQYIDGEMPNYNFFISTTKFDQLIKDKFKRHSVIVDYHEVGLYPNKYLDSYFNGIIKEEFKLQTTLGWDPLFLGNWKIFLESLIVRMKTVSYETYIGTSHITKAPKDANCIELNEFILRDNGKEMAIPQYIWAFLFNEDEKIVVVGVNTPYYPFWDNSNPLPCESICHEIPWLQMLALFQNVSTFGLIYCCPVHTVNHFLHGFPKIY